ncbi:helix-turn-helix transcriptional regulator [Deinococcus planocerae]|uniref:helix-turn-helix transcriptional regulator n=1 Tax=Deinococcus planocerae TaxID=1737569 RepID=UPI000C7E9644|nr:response regulator transcription factor [Deinococcus planocerae]
MPAHPHPSVRVALRSPALAAGVAAWLRDFGFAVTEGEEADVLVVDDAWLADPGALAAELEGAAGVVALGSRAWVGTLRDLAPGGWASLGTDATPAELLAGVLAAAAGLAALPPEDMPAAPDESEDPDPGGVTLTPRERDVLSLLAEGLSNKRAARELGVSESTVKFHVQAVYSKLGVQSRAGAVARGVHLGLISV